MTNKIIMCIRGRVGEDITDEQAEAIIKRYEDEALRVQMLEGKDRETALRDVLTRDVLNRERDTYQKKRTALLDATKFKAAAATIDNMSSQGDVRLFKKGRPLGLENAVQIFLTGGKNPYEGSHASIDAQRGAIYNKYLGGMVKELDRAGLMHMFSTTDFHLPIAKELGNLNSRTPQPSTASPEIKKIAAILRKYTESMRQELNKAGAYIGSLDGWAGAQSHSAEKITGNKAEWKAATLDKVDWQRMNLNDPREIDAFLDSMYADITSGKIDGKHTANLAKRASQSRELHFKDTESWFAYNAKYGQGDFLENIVLGLDRQTRALSLMRNLGTNPKAALDKLTDGLDSGKIERIYAQLDGSANQSANHTAAVIADNIRQWNAMRQLGGAFFAQVSDLPAKAVMLQQRGAGFTEAAGNSASASMSLFTTPETRQMVADAWDIGLEAIMGNLFANFSSADGVAGSMSKITRLFYKMNLQTQWAVAQKKATAQIISHILGRQADKGYGALIPESQLMLKQYGISEAEWDTVRAGGLMQADDGRSYIVPQGLSGDVETKMRTLISGEVNAIALEPDAYIRSITNWGSRKGTVVGETARMLFQYKTFGLTYLRNVWGSVLYNSGKADFAMMAQLMVGGMAMGYVSESLRALAAGKDLPEADAATLGKSISRSGLGAIYGDMLSSYVQTGGYKSLGEAVGGPTFGFVNDAAAIPFEDKPAFAAAKLGRQSIPFNNLFYVKPVLDYAIFNSIIESSNPGWAKRSESYNTQGYMLDIARPSRTLAKDLSQ